MSAGQHKQQNRHPKSSRGGRLQAKLGRKGQRASLADLRRKYVRLNQPRIPKHGLEAL